MSDKLNYLQNLVIFVSEYVRKKSILKIEQIRERIKNFTEEISKEYYLQGSGIASEVNFGKIYEKYPALFTNINLLELKSHLSASLPGSEDERKGKLFLEAFYGEILSELNKELNAEFYKHEGSSKIEIDENRYVSYRSTMIHLFNEPNREKRKTIRKSIDTFAGEKLNPILEEIFIKEQERISSLGFDNKIEMFKTLSGIDIYNIESIMQKFLKDTEDVYADNLGRIAKDKLNTHIHDLERDDLMFLMRAPEFDVYFPKDEMFTKVSHSVKQMGVDIYAGNNITFDIEARDNKSPRAFCSPVKIPGEVYLVLYPRGGEDDYTAFLHELGHALHFANASTSLPFEYKWYGDNSVTEGYAMTFDHLTMNERWMNENLGVNYINNNDYFTYKAMRELFMLRRFAAKVSYEIKLNESGGLKGKKELYSEIFTEATKARYSSTQYLLDVDNYFYCIRYIRAWMLQANIHTYMNSNFGNEWFKDKNAGDVLMNMWSMGQKYNADELSMMYGGYKLSTEPLLDNINSILN
jgi:hypothetical protein